MTSFDLSIIPMALLNQYEDSFDGTLQKEFDLFEESELTIESFNFYSSVSAVYSSKIEGENIEIDSYIKHKRFGTSFLPDYTKKIDDLYDAYEFAKSNSLNEANILKCHGLLTRSILQESNRGTYRTSNMYVITDKGDIEYIAVDPYNLKKEIDKWIKDLAHILNKELSFSNVFYFASMFHLVFLKIHPFDDGNGRMSRLIEKWFLSNYLGSKAWFLTSERFYYNNKEAYFNSIRKLGLDYEELNYENAMIFLKLLPLSIRKF
jgi:Fic family protein